MTDRYVEGERVCEVVIKLWPSDFLICLADK